MTTEKAELRAAALHDAGVRVEDLLDASHAASYRAEGAAVALQQASETVRGIHAQIDNVVEDEGIEPNTAQFAKGWVTRAVSILDQLARNALANLQAQRGHAQGVQAAVGLLQGLHGQEVAQGAQQAQRVAEAAQEAPVAPAQEAPAPPVARAGIKARRNSEAPPGARAGAKKRRRGVNGAANGARVADGQDT